jgi:hypothetical protein
VRIFHPDAIIMRPSVVFGPEDQFFNRFATMARFMPALPLVGGGATKFQPVFMSGRRSPWPSRARPSQAQPTNWAVRKEAFVPEAPRGTGRPPEDRRGLAHAFVAKAVPGIPTTSALIGRLGVDKSLRRVCGWERRAQVPSEGDYALLD